MFEIKKPRQIDAVDDALDRRVRRMFVKGWEPREIADYLTLQVGTVQGLLRRAGFAGVR
jgi:DNA-directed RNA polymerase specialized sigma24 family protein